MNVALIFMYTNLQPFANRFEELFMHTFDIIHDQSSAWFLEIVLFVMSVCVCARVFICCVFVCVCMYICVCVRAACMHVFLCVHMCLPLAEASNNYSSEIKPYAAVFQSLICTYDAC